MPILTLQKRARELGRIRIGQVVPTSEGKTRPEKLDRFRLTSASKPLLEKVAELYGGDVVEWQPQGGGPKAWEVVTTATRLPIMVPPQPVTQWFEFWTAGGCKHRCDGRTNWQTGEPCDLESTDHLRALERPTTRLNVVLRDVEGIGVWRLETHGWNAAVELPDAAEFLAAVGGYVNGWVSLEERVSISDGKTRRFMVPTIEIDVTPAQLMAGKGRIQPPTLEGPVRQAIESGVPNDPVTGDEVASYYQRLEHAASSGECMELYEEAKAVGIIRDDSPTGMALYAAIGAKGKQLSAAAAEDDGGSADHEDVVDAEVVDDDADAVWDQVLKVAGDLGVGLSQLNADFEQRYALAPGQASAGELRHYLQVLQTEGVAA